jgi:hypothetical protein
MPSSLQNFAALKLEREKAESLFEAEDAKVRELTAQLRKERDLIEQPF